MTTAKQSQNARHDHAIVLLLQALPDDRLESILVELGVEPEKLPGKARTDDRRCQECGYGYIRCRAIDEKAPEKHDWTPR